MRRPFLDRTRHGLLMAVLLCILLARTAVPAGWMPMADADGAVVLAPCSGMGATGLSKAMSGMAMAHPGDHVAHDRKDAGDRHNPDPGGDHPCAGAGLAVALGVPLADVSVAPAIRSFVEIQRPSFALVGRGLAAPPPPATGPPFQV